MPIYDTDQENERWSKNLWRNFELWEKIEVKLRQRKRIWILGAILLFLVFCSFPVISESWPRWQAKKAVRRLGHEINLIKKEASLAVGVLELKFHSGPGLAFSVWRKESCDAETGEELRKGQILTDSGDFSLLTGEIATGLGLGGFSDRFCYDSIHGSGLSNESVGFAVIPANDIEIQKLDRIGVIVLTGSTAEISYN